MTWDHIQERPRNRAGPLLLLTNVVICRVVSTARAGERQVGSTPDAGVTNNKQRFSTELTECTEDRLLRI